MFILMLLIIDLEISLYFLNIYIDKSFNSEFWKFAATAVNLYLHSLLQPYFSNLGKVKPEIEALQ